MFTCLECNDVCWNLTEGKQKVCVLKVTTAASLCFTKLLQKPFPKSKIYFYYGVLLGLHLNCKFSDQISSVAEIIIINKSLETSSKEWEYLIIFLSDMVTYLSKVEIRNDGGNDSLKKLWNTLYEDVNWKYGVS